MIVNEEEELEVHATFTDNGQQVSMAVGRSSAAKSSRKMGGSISPSKAERAEIPEDREYEGFDFNSDSGEETDEKIHNRLSRTP